MAIESQKKHLGLYVDSRINKNELLIYLLSAKITGKLKEYICGKGAFFSDLAIAEILEEERKYDKCLISERKLITYSSGEKKKLFIKHILNKNPDFIILDNPLDHLDMQSRNTFIVDLNKIAEKTTLIQLSSRVSDLLPFIDDRFILKDKDFEIMELSNLKDELKSTDEKTLSVPESGQNIPVNSRELIKMDKVSVSYDGKPIVKDITWTIKQSEFWQLIGPNGSGKSTLLSLITGESTKGYGQDLYLFGKKKGSGESVWEIKQRIGYFAPSMTELFKRNNTLSEMILSGFFDTVGLYDTPSTMQYKQVLQWLKLAKLQEFKNFNFNKLTAGQQRLGLILRAVVKNPPLLILDEPTEGLDDHGAQLVIDLIIILRSQGAMAIIFVSHRLEKGLKAEAIFELVPSTEGSIGRIKNDVKL
ncbi:MAG: ATP-binding cassette domain-containing protein [Leeuwenhoekiella sp.]